MKQIVVKPLFTEKTLSQAAVGWYAFKVARTARKGTIARVVADAYKVTVIDVRTLHMHGKTRKAGRRQMITRKPDWKKALVRLAKGQTINEFETPTQEVGKS